MLWLNEKGCHHEKCLQLIEMINPAEAAEEEYISICDAWLIIAWRNQSAWQYAIYSAHESLAGQ